ncbi:conjugative transposon protein TraM [Pedobacter sp. AW1-32]|uniref:conjugative transposon protein TraM n=1 Tax=Pedobacter sp. AW1-32 TaxID=3383026 RepID=UPI003FF0C4A2
MKFINLKQPRYILPLLALPFIFIFFYLYLKLTGSPIQAEKPTSYSGIAQLPGSSEHNEIPEKLQAYRKSYKTGDGSSAVELIPSNSPVELEQYRSFSIKSNKMADSIALLSHKARIAGYTQNPYNNANQSDKEIAKVLNFAYRENQQKPQQQQNAVDPLASLTAQLRFRDSISSASKQKKTQSESSSKSSFSVSATAKPTKGENILYPEVEHEEGIPAVIEESVLVRAGSRVKLRLLREISAGGIIIPKASSIYAQVSAFSAQRVNLLVSSVSFQGEIIPVNLQAYDIDGITGIYVPNSSFREYTKDLGSLSQQVSGVNPGIDQQQLRGLFSRMFQSSASAVDRYLKENKATLRSSTRLYLVDNNKSSISPR